MKSVTRLDVNPWMARALVFLLACLGMLTLLGASPAAASTDHVYDPDDRLTAAEEAELEERILQISTEYGQDIVVAISETNGESPMVWADDYFDYQGYGLGPQRSGVLLLIAPEARDWWISTRGTSIQTFTDAGIQVMGDAIKVPLADNDWFGGAKVFVDRCEVFMEAARSGSPITKAPETLVDKLIKGAGSLVAGIVGGIGTAWVMVHAFFVRKMKNEGLEPTARDYVVDGSFAVTGGVDEFVTTRVSRTKRAQSSGGSSTHRSSSGATHGGGGGKF